MGLLKDLGLSEEVEVHNRYNRATPRGRDYFKKQVASLITVVGGGAVLQLKPGIALGLLILSAPVSYYWSEGSEEIPDGEKEGFKNV